MEFRIGQKVRTEQLRPGQVLDQLEVLSHSRSESTIEAAATGTRVMAVPADSFEAMLGQDPDLARRVLAADTSRPSSSSEHPDLARRVLALGMRQLQRLTREAADGNDDQGG